MADKASIRVLVHGRVQGVYFRDFTCRKASEYDLAGYVKNLSDGRTVEVYAEGEKAALEKLVSHLRVGPPNAVVEEITVSYGDYAESFNSFDIRY
ncbi:MAG: acylphosphatase [Dehalococcoidales bacterium]|nr:acylphosphatase [Dehalococcoidales bacterium]